MRNKALPVMSLLTTHEAVPAEDYRHLIRGALELSYVSVNSDVPYEVVAYVGSDHVISIQREMYERLKVIDDQN